MLPPMRKLRVRFITLRLRPSMIQPFHVPDGIPGLSVCADGEEDPVEPREAFGPGERRAPWELLTLALRCLLPARPPPDCVAATPGPCWSGSCLGPSPSAPSS
mmetsp:Transcript_86501/g.253187  ORF Transcript_86501/g.253187 Transcript_86501/m.253187 type:complete len:103 (-) Transcript_86501:594-902(-)